MWEDDGVWDDKEKHKDNVNIVISFLEKRKRMLIEYLDDVKLIEYLEYYKEEIKQLDIVLKIIETNDEKSRDVR